MEGAHKIGKVAEPDRKGDIGDRIRAVGQQASGAAQSGAHQILMRRHPEHPREQPQKMEGAEPGLLRRTIEVDRLMRIGVDPGRRLHCATGIARPRCPAIRVTRARSDSAGAHGSIQTRP